MKNRSHPPHFRRVFELRDKEVGDRLDRETCVCGDLKIAHIHVCGFERLLYCSVFGNSTSFRGPDLLRFLTNKRHFRLLTNAELRKANSEFCEYKIGYKIGLPD